MRDAGDLLNSIKQAAMDAVEASKPVAAVFGKVTSVSPIVIQVEQKLTLGEKQLILTRTASQSLVQGEHALLLRMQGGQKYIVLDRL